MNSDNKCTGTFLNLGSGRVLLLIGFVTVKRETNKTKSLAAVAVRSFITQLLFVFWRYPRLISVLVFIMLLQQ